MVYSLINVFLIDVMRKILCYFAPKNKIGAKTVFVVNGAYRLVSERCRKFCTEYFILSVLATVPK